MSLNTEGNKQSKKIKTSQDLKRRI
ncbi:hypothetical protein F383_25536 [Gossypium arboreum]|uniref:Uncharacterized protein n=1 Tax=Gossypium arboreum TaxID=29729 RepID=A0A0B0P3X9_GOSAR|nr:hypothetical protein F383_25536 [Gossypium arboreum]